MNTDFTHSGLHSILPCAQIATKYVRNGESDEKKRQAGANKYSLVPEDFRSTHARGDSGLRAGDALYTDRQSTFNLISAQNCNTTYIHDDKTV
ncbi:hypothetical protein AVEN_263598-1 [Araneus ventricosus]|uniref:Uncharacterized protein n=1 Tax=Araneus ventricosus TaxID=182803 RepID=A0A4Y2SGH9_ARAVE|nr:hypothetical protein AVEN_263598-1 [Araneus ventricosus]